MRKQLEVFKTNLEEFARMYKKQINEDPDFRKQFNQLCMKIGVDPLASNKGFWAELLGVGDFYYELAIQICEICLSTRELNGGLIDTHEVLKRLQKRRKNQTSITMDDIKRSVRKLHCFGDGFTILKIGSNKLIQSIPLELSDDNTAVLNMAQNKGFVSESLIKKELHWDTNRVQISLKLLMKEGIVWIDTSQIEAQYWFPTLFFGSQNEV